MFKDPYDPGKIEENDTAADSIEKIQFLVTVDIQRLRLIRIFIPSVILTILIIFLIMKKIPHPATAIFIFILSYVVMAATTEFYHFHGEMEKDIKIKEHTKNLETKC